MHERIRTNLEEKDQMLGAIGHDLRTPLTALRLRVESVEDDNDREKMVATIDDMQNMLDDILSLARVGQDREPQQTVDLASLVEAVAEDHEDAGASITLAELPRTLVRVHPRTIRRAIGNLIDNAAKYGSHATISLSRIGPDVSVVIDDAGPGIDPARVEEMLQPFTRLESSRNRETGGTGLGLAIVKAIAIAEGGRLALVNRPEGGLRATFTLPVAHPA
jgi:signal transduction histidine kinase